jgi:hypothetical protein
MTTVGSGQSQTILQGQSDSGDIVLSGGTEAVAHGGSLFDAGLVAHAQVNAGGALFDGGFADYTTVTSGGVMYIGPQLRLFYLPPYSPDRNPDELVWKHLKSDTVGRTSITCIDDFRNKVKSSSAAVKPKPAPSPMKCSND